MVTPSLAIFPHYSNILLFVWVLHLCVLLIGTWKHRGPARVWPQACTVAASWSCSGNTCILHDTVHQHHLSLLIRTTLIVRRRIHMFTCKTCGESFAGKKALRSVSSHLRPRCRRSFLLNGTDLPTSILHSTKRPNTHASDFAVIAIRNSLVRRLCARTKLPNTHSGASYVASHLLQGKRLEAIGWPNTRHRVQCRTHPDLCTNAINAMSHCALLDD